MVGARDKPDLRLCDVGEAALLAQLARLLGRPFARTSARQGNSPAPSWALGVGDDAAVLPQAGGASVSCCDLLVEDVDFRRRWASFADIGHKAAAVNLSDLAAMGARGTGLLLALALQPTERVADVLALVRSVDRVGRRHGAPLIGGDLSRICGPMVVGVTALGEVAPPGLRRKLAAVGDVVVVTGRLGAARAGLAALEGELALAAGAWPSWLKGLAARQLRPTPHLQAGQFLAAVGSAGGVHAATDVSDGLLQDAGHLCRQDLAVQLNTTALPLARGLLPAARLTALGSQGESAARRCAEQWALAGGEDFVLVAAICPRRWPNLAQRARAKGLQLYPVGTVQRGRAAPAYGEARTRLASPFDHFA